MFLIQRVGSCLWVRVAFFLAFLSKRRWFCGKVAYKPQLKTHKITSWMKQNDLFGSLTLGRCAARRVCNDRCQHDCGPPQFLQNVMSEPSGHITVRILSIHWKDKGGKLHPWTDAAETYGNVRANCSATLVNFPQENKRDSLQFSWCWTMWECVTSQP